MKPLDRVLPRFHHRERHSRWIAAPPETVWEGLHRVRFDEVAVMRLGLRLLGLPARLLGRAEPVPVGTFLAGYQERGFTVLVDEPERELVGASIARYWQPAGAERIPFWGAKVATDFRVEPERGGTRLSTETRVLATDARARRSFQAYWIVIRLPSGLIRRELLCAIARCAERAANIAP